MSTRLIREIESRMQQLGLTPTSVATKAGLRRDSVRDILRGKSRRPSNEMLMKVARVLECSVEELTGETVIPRVASPSRAHALEGYITLEQSLCFLLRDLAKLDDETAIAIFYGLQGSAVRAQVLHKLKEIHHPDAYQLFWESLLVEVGEVCSEYYDVTRPYPKTAQVSFRRLMRFIDRLDLINSAIALLRTAIVGEKVSPSLHSALQHAFAYPLTPTHPLKKFVDELYSPEAPTEPKQGEAG